MKKFYLLKFTIVAVSIIVLSLCVVSCKTLKAETASKNIIVFDTDVGTDDAMAFFMWKQIGVIQPDYILASFGNTTLDNACRNAIALKKYLGLSGQVVKGLPDPKTNVVDTTLSETSFHGRDGLANISEQLFKKLELTDKDFSDYISFEDFEKKLENVDSIIYISIGPETNLTKLIQNEKIKSRIHNLYLMGGGIHVFNNAHETEFNFAKDPEAVRAILNSGLNITLFPLDLTITQQVSQEQIDVLKKYGSYPDFITFMEFNLQSNISFNKIHAAVLHDTMPVLYDAYPEKFVVEDMHITSNEYGHIDVSENGVLVHVATHVTPTLLYDMIEKEFVDEAK